MLWPRPNPRRLLQPCRSYVDNKLCSTRRTPHRSVLTCPWRKERILWLSKPGKHWQELLQQQEHQPCSSGRRQTAVSETWGASGFRKAMVRLNGQCPRHHSRFVRACRCEPVERDPRLAHAQAAAIWLEYRACERTTTFWKSARPRNSRLKSPSPRRKSWSGRGHHLR